jgi:hypothetical protein
MRWRGRLGLNGLYWTSSLLDAYKLLILWSGRRGSNPRRPAWELDRRLIPKQLSSLPRPYSDHTGPRSFRYLVHRRCPNVVMSCNISPHLCFFWLSLQSAHFFAISRFPCPSSLCHIKAVVLRFTPTESVPTSSLVSRFAAIALQLSRIRNCALPGEHQGVFRVLQERSSRPWYQSIRLALNACIKSAIKLPSHARKPRDLPAIPRLTQYISE